MKESVFVRENAPKWKHFESVISKRSKASADELADYYIRVTDDLAYAATFYPDSKTTNYLNQLSRSFHSGIYQNKRERASRILHFFKFEIPEAVYHCHRQLFYAFIFFMLAILVGVVSSLYESGFVRQILGDEYVNMTLSNIEKGEPLAVYKSMSPGAMFLGISSNNIYVAVVAFVYGIFFSVGTVYFLVQNGLMVGAFVTMFAQKGLLKVALLGIFLHGALELSAIVIAGAAGMAIGNSLLFPGTYSRVEALTRAGNRAVKMVVGLVPIFIVAAIFESFVTRYSAELPVFFSLAIIVSSFTFIIWYFIILPIQLKSKYK